MCGWRKKPSRSSFFSVSLPTLRKFSCESSSTILPTLSYFSSFSRVKDKVNKKVIFLHEKKLYESSNTQSFYFDVGGTYLQKFWHEDMVIFPVRVSTLNRFLQRGGLFQRRFCVVICVIFSARVQHFFSVWILQGNVFLENTQTF